MIRVTAKVPSYKPLMAQLKLKLFAPEFIALLKKEVVDGQIVRLIRSGQSPVEGVGRFVQYKDKNSYPGKKKASSPVNLTLTKEMLSKYTVQQKTPYSIWFGYPESTPEKLRTKIIANNEGTYKLKGRKLDKSVRSRIRELNAPLAVAARGGKRRKNINQIAKATKGIPARRFLPLASANETFTISVIRKIKDLYARRVRALLSFK